VCEISDDLQAFLLDEGFPFLQLRCFCFMGEESVEELRKVPAILLVEFTSCEIHSGIGELFAEEQFPASRCEIGTPEYR
jgi:hypothetical protein